jgi:penicillin amidase
MIRAVLLLLIGMSSAMAQTVKVQGISSPVEIAMDAHGIPHISAGSVEDAFFGQGYAAAMLRLWQIDSGYRRQSGRLAEAFGADFVPYDQAARLVFYRGDIAEEWLRYDPRVPPIARAFVAGINARVRQVRADPALLPPEFVALDVLPLEWDADDLVRLRSAGAPNVRAEFRRARLACRGALDADLLMVPLEPAWTTFVPKDLDPCALPYDTLKAYDLLTAPLPYARAVRKAEAVPFPEPDVDARNGSNAWVISPQMSGTGRPILANDPHLPFSVPGPRLITHLRAPGFELAGAGFPSRPGMQFGHTDRIAFGRTDFQIDQEDLYVLDVNPAGTEYRTPNGWAPITRVKETIAVRGEAPREVEIATTLLGPIIHESPGRAIVLRAIWMEPGAAIGLEFIPKVLATNWDEFRLALRYAVWGTNYLYADVEGNIGWQSAGLVPRRPNHDGLLPVPAAGFYPWDGILSLDEMPGEFNPQRGWIASANQMPLPPDWPVAALKISFEWIADDRYRRIAAVLGGQRIHDIADSIALQHDTLSGRAERLLPLLAAITAPDLSAEVALLRGWDRRMAPDSPAAALFAFFWSQLSANLHASLVPQDLADLIGTLHPHVLMDRVEQMPARLQIEPSLRQAAAKLRAAAGADPAGWAWGRIHALDLRHQLDGILPADPPHNVRGESGGDGATVMARWWASAARPQASGGALFAGVFDVGEWDASRVINAPGQSGEPGSPHFADLLPLWVQGAYFPLPFSPEAVAAATVQTITLTP